MDEPDIDGELDPVETGLWFSKLARTDFQVGITGITGAVDDPDQQLYENYACYSARNYSGYCNREVEQQSREPDQEKRKQLVWEIDQRLQQEGARPIIYYGRGATCWHPYVKRLTTMANGIYNGWRMEDVWLDK